MKLVSVNVGKPVKYSVESNEFYTGYIKTPQKNYVRVNSNGLDGDGQADLRVHGGADKAVYAFSQDAYKMWQDRFSTPPLSPVIFGENLTIDSFDESQIEIGDLFKINQVVLEVCQPRLPCQKLNWAMNDSNASKNFIDLARPGIYFRVIDEGEVCAGDSIQLIKNNSGVSITDIWNLLIHKKINDTIYKKALKISNLNKNIYQKLIGAR